MAHIEIKVQSLKDRNTQTEPLFDGMGESVEYYEIDGFAILEHGMRSGKTSCSFVARNNGKAVIMEISAEMLHTCVAGLNGAEMRFMNEKKKK